MAVAIDQGTALPRTGEGDPYAAYRFVGNAVALVVVAASIIELIANAFHPIPRDFLSFWGAAQLVLAGHPAAAYDSGTLHAVQKVVADFGSGHAEMPFPYPPAYLALVTPFGLLPFPLSMAIWTGCTFAFYLWAARKLIPEARWLAAAFPAVYANANDGQNAFLTVGLLMSGLALAPRRPFVAGLILGCLIIKPQLALLLPVAFIAARSWRVIGGAAISSTGILLGGALLLGPATTQAWLHQLPLYAMITREGLVGWSKLSSVYAAARAWGIAPAAAMAIHAIGASAAAVAVWRVWRSTTAENPMRAAVLCAASALASPYLFFYDGVILVPAFLILAALVRRPAFFFALWCLPLLQIAQIGVLDLGMNLNAILAVVLTGALFALWKAVGGEPARGSDAALLRIEERSPVTLC
jgi:hypothetical protein